MSLLVLLKAVDYTVGDPVTPNPWLDQSSSGNYDATVEAGGTVEKNAAGNGIVLNGSTSWTFPDVNVENAWTVSAWYKNTGLTTPEQASIVTQIYDGENQNVNLLIGYASNGSGYNTSISGGFIKTNTSYNGSLITLSNDVWTNIQVTWDGADMKTYINGVFLGTTTPEMGITAASSVLAYRIGRGYDNTNYMTGEIGEVRIYNYALSQNQVTADYNESYSTFNKLMVLLKAVDFTVGESAWADQSGNGNDATLEVGGTAAKNAAGNGIVLDGSTSWTFPNVEVGNTFTFNVWVKQRTVSQNSYIISQISDSDINAFIGDRNGNGSYRCGYYNANPVAGDPFTLTNGQWTNIQMTWDGANLKTYINSVLSSTVPSIVEAIDFESAYRIGASPSTSGTLNYLTGEIGEVRVYNYALTQNQVTADYNDSYSTLNKLMVLLKGVSYTDESTTWADESGNGYDATLDVGGVAAKNAGGNGVVLDGSTFWSFSDIGISNVWTAGVWYRVTDPTVASAIVTQAYDGTNGNGLTVNYDNSNVNGSFNTDDTLHNGNPVGIVTGQWTNIQITWNGLNMTTYKNGVFATTTTIGATSMEYSAAYYIGKGPVSGLIKGEIGEVRIYSYALTQAQVTADYNQSYSTFNKLMVLLKAVDYTTGPWLDETPNENDATKVGGGNLTKLTDGDGIVSIELDGTTAVTFPNIGVANAWTTSVWYKNTAAQTAGGADIIGQQLNGSDYSNCQIGDINGNNDNTYQVGFISNDQAYLGAGFSLVNGEWTNIQVTWDGTTMKTYVDNVLQELATPVGVATDCGTPFLIGKNIGGNDAFMVGEIGEVRIYSYPLTATQVQSDYYGSYYDFHVHTYPDPPIIHIRPKVVNNTVRLDWTAPLLYGGEPYEFVLSSPQDTAGPYRLPSYTTSYVVRNLTNGVPYTYSISAENDEYGDSDSATYRTVIPGPKAPRLTTAVAVQTSLTTAFIDVNDSRPYFTAQSASGDRLWKNIVSSADGTILAAIINSASAKIWLSRDSGLTWVETDSGVNTWQSIAISSDGSRIVAGAYDDGIYTSIDSGNNWTPVSGIGGTNYYDIAITPDGSIFYATVGIDTVYKGVYVSEGSWTATPSTVAIGESITVYGVACDNTGTIVYVTVRGGDIFRSDDSGATWSSVKSYVSGSNWGIIRCSSDGSNIVAIDLQDGGLAGSIWISNDSGVLWDQPTSLASLVWSGLAMSSDGSIISAAVAGGSIWISRDSGDTFAEQTVTNGKAWKGLALSANGLRLAAVAEADFIYALNVLHTYNIGWTVAKTKVLSGEDSTPLNSTKFGRVTIPVKNTLDLTNNMYSFNASYINDAGYTLPVETNPIGNVQYNFTSPSKTYPSSDNNFTSVASSDDGQKLVTCSNDDVDSSGHIWTSIDGGLNWTERMTDSTRNWSSVASSPNGVVLIAAENGGSLWTSSNSGVTWTERPLAGPSPMSWNVVAIGRNSMYMAAAEGQNVYVSSDGGVTWSAGVNVDSGNELTLRSLVISSDGTVLFAGGNNGNGIIYTSSDSGQSWDPSFTPSSSGAPVNGDWKCIRMSADMEKLIAIDGNNGQVYLSIDFGDNWAALSSSPSYYWASVTVSADFTKIAVADDDGDGIYYSTDSGQTWTLASFSNGNVYWRSITGDSTGRYLTGVTSSDSIWFSNNYGASWYSYADPGSAAWASMTISKDGSIMVAGAEIPWISNDGGVSWRSFRLFTITPGSLTNFSTYISDDNTFIAVAVNSNEPTDTNYIWTSRDFGYTWVQQTGIASENWVGIAGSANGGVIIAIQSSGSIRISTDHCESANSLTSINDISGVASDSTGKYIAVCLYGGSIWVSDDYGTLFTEQADTRAWTAIASDSTGKYLVACVDDGDIWTSNNYGDTWIVREVVSGGNNWVTVACSSYGNNIIAGSADGKVWTSCDFGVTWNEQDVVSGNWVSVASSANALTVITSMIESGSGPILIGKVE